MNPFGKHNSLMTLGAACWLLGCAEERETIETAVLYVAADAQQTTALAGFYGDIFGVSRCTTEVIDRCEVATCLDGGAVRSYVDGGEVEFLGDELQATLDTGMVADAEGSLGPGLAREAGLPALSDDEDITINVRGRGTVSTVQGKVTMPTRVVLTEPALVENACQNVDPESVEPISVTRGEDFPVRWTATDDEDVDVLFAFDDIADYEGDPERERFTQIRCLYTASEELADIPNDVVARMPQGVKGTFSVRQIVSNAKLVGNWSITFGGYWEMCSPVVAE